MKIKIINPDYFRNFIFGIEDSIVSTAGVLFGLATAFTDKSTILTTGFIIVVVESISMGAGAYISEESTHQLKLEYKHTDNPVINGFVMFLSYFSTGLMLLLPYIFFNPNIGKPISILLSLILLFTVGYLPTKNIKSALKMIFVSILATLAGYIIGKLHYILS